MVDYERPTERVSKTTTFEANFVQFYSPKSAHSTALTTSDSGWVTPSRPPPSTPPEWDLIMSLIR